MRLSHWRPDKRIWLSTALLFITFEPLHFWPAAAIALVPWLHLVATTKDRKTAFIQSFWLCLFFSVLTFSWVAYVVRTFGGVPLPLSILLLILFGTVGQPQFYLAALPLRAPLRKIAGFRQEGPSEGPHEGKACSLTILGWAILSGLFYAGLDWTLPKIFVDTLGHSMIYASNLRQIADIGGPALLTFLLLLANLSIFTLFCRFKHRGEPAIWGALRSALPLLVVTLIAWIASDRYGAFRNRQVTERLGSPLKTKQVAAIQANIGDIEKLASERGFTEASERVMRSYFDLSDQALRLAPKPEIILWPETAYPSSFRSPHTSGDFARDKEVEGWSASRKSPLVFGGYDRDLLGKSYNSVFYLSPDGTDSRYAKSILIPFGEYIPGMESIPWVRDLFPMVGFFGKGPGSVIREIADLKTQPVICYEILFPNFTADAVRAGAEAIFNFTNDSWFGPHGAPYYHLNLAAFRSIETRIPQLRATNTGFSALILPNGEITSRTRLFEPEIMSVTLPVIEPIPTLILKWGDWFGKTALLLSSLGLIALNPRLLQRLRPQRRS
jgi:apolipoprotein N-acyltransferase